LNLRHALEDWLVTPELTAAGFGLLSALVWGAGDFSGGLATRRSSLLSVTMISNAVGAITILLFALWRGAPIPGTGDLLLGVSYGVAGVIGILALYRALSLERMGIAAPITAVIANIISVGWAALSEGLPNPVRVLGFVLACAGVWFVAQPNGPQGRPRGLGLAAVSGLDFGVFFILLGNLSEGTDTSWPLVMVRLTSLVIILGVFLASRQAFRLEPSARPLAVGAGVMDTLGNAFYALAAQAGRLDVAAVLSSLYPAMTVLLARVVLHERVSRVQLIGALTALMAIALIVI
jgi:drug/metabolite transporter (DMT)-like permease